MCLSLPLSHISLSSLSRWRLGNHLLGGGGSDFPDEGGESGLGGGSDLPDEGGVSDLPDEGGGSDLPDEGGGSDLPDEGGESDLPDEGGVSDLPEEGRTCRTREEGVQPCWTGRRKGIRVGALPPSMAFRGTRSSLLPAGTLFCPALCTTLADATMELVERVG